MAWTWFDSTEAASLAAELVDNYCLRREAHRTSPKKLARLVRSQDDLTRRVQGFNRSHRFNFYKRAQLLSRLQQGLRARGIPDSEVASVFDQYLLVGAEGDRAQQ